MPASDSQQTGGENWWREMSPYLDEALDLPPEQREEWLRSIRERDPQLGDRLSGLLDAQQRIASEQFLERSSGINLTEPPAEGLTVGPYTLVSEIGQGGMGSVWLAARNDGRFDRKVAIKFLNMACSGQTGQERFRREGRILGSLRHSHIAELVDAGVMGSGTPYLVLEHVDGTAIDEYCKQKNLEVDARLALFLEVLAAVAHAHANLIVHRDIKPSNVLVNASGQVKLLDFGIAKLVEAEDATAPTLLSRDGSAMTPLYAAPEQVTGGAVTTATDVYALGLLLYLLLAGQHPAGEGPHAPASLMRAIVELEPPPLSSRRGTPFSADLNTIVGKALQKRPEQRYASVTAFAEDLRRYLSNEPIRARPETLLYRTGKFVRRNRLVLAGVSLASLALIATTAIAIRQAAEARSRFAQVRQVARTFLFDFYNELDKVPGNTKAKAMVISTASEYLDNLALSAGNDRGLLMELAESYDRLARVEGGSSSVNLNQRGAGLEHRKRALEILRGLAAKAGQPDPKIVYLEAMLTDDLRNLGHLEEALAMGRQAAVDGDNLKGHLSPTTLEDMSSAHANLARVFLDLGRMVEAEAEMGISERLREAATGGKLDRYLIVLRQDRADLLSSVGRIDEGVKVLEGSLDDGRKLIEQAPKGARYEEAYRNRQVTYAMLAEMYDNPISASLEQPEKALVYRQRLREGWEHLLSLDSNNQGARADLAVCHSETAVTLMKLDSRAAVAMARTGLAIFEQLARAAPNDDYTRYRSSRAANRLAMTLLADRRPLEAQAAIQSSLRVHRELLGKRKGSARYRASIAWTLIVAGQVEHALNHPAQARAALEEAIRLAEPMTDSLDTAYVKRAVTANEALSQVLTGPERCKPLERAQQLWQGYKGPSTPWLQKGKAGTRQLLEACSAGQ